MFEHERLQVYQLARELNREICRLTKIAAKGCADHIDQIVRGGASIARNLAEGSGEWSPKEKAKFYRYAKRSATECCAALDVMVDYEMLRESEYCVRQGVAGPHHPDADQSDQAIRRRCA